MGVLRVITVLALRLLISVLTANEANPVKIDTPFLAALLLMGTTLSARIAAQGVEQALLSTAIEWSMNRIKRKFVSAEEML